MKRRVMKRRVMKRRVKKKHSRLRLAVKRTIRNRAKYPSCMLIGLFLLDARRGVCSR